MAVDTSVKTYDPKLVVLTFMGIIISGYADGTFINAKASGPAFKHKKGADGSVDRVNTNTWDLDIDVTLKQTANSNGDLSTIFLADKLSNAGKGELKIKDLNGTSLIFAPQAWITDGPDGAFSDDLTNRVWKLHTGPAEVFIGTNN